MMMNGEKKRTVYTIIGIHSLDFITTPPRRNDGVVFFS